MRIRHPSLSRRRIQLWVKRDDLLHPHISGNKWRKLKYVLRHALTEQARGVLTFGGAYSNHLHAVAAAGRELSLATVGVVRGEAGTVLNPTLSDAQGWGMRLEFVDRRQYRLRHQPDYLEQLARRHPGFHMVPEGGSCALALPGVAEIWRELPTIDELILPVASGGTLAGLLTARPPGTRVRGYAVLKGQHWLARTVHQLYPASLLDSGWQLQLEHHGGGYAKCSAADRAAIMQLASELHVPLEPVYSGKALLGLFRDIDAGLYSAGSRLVFLHTGGLQGARGGL